MEKYVNVYLSNNIHKSSGIYDSSVFQDCVYVKKSEKRTDKVEDVRIESDNMTYRRIGRKKEQQQRTEQDDEYVRRFINNLR